MYGTCELDTILKHILKLHFICQTKRINNVYYYQHIQTNTEKIILYVKLEGREEGRVNGPVW